MSVAMEIQKLHDAADWVDEFLPAITPPLNRRCEACLGVVYLTQGRHSGKWFWSHLEIDKCKFDQTGLRRFFDERQQAIDAPDIWLTA